VLFHTILFFVVHSFCSTTLDGYIVVHCCFDYVLPHALFPFYVRYLRLPLPAFCFRYLPAVCVVLIRYLPFVLRHTHFTVTVTYHVVLLFCLCTFTCDDYVPVITHWVCHHRLRLRITYLVPARYTFCVSRSVLRSYRRWVYGLLPYHPFHRAAILRY